MSSLHFPTFSPTLINYASGILYSQFSKSEIISALPGENINIENDIQNKPTNRIPIFIINKDCFFINSPLNIKNNPQTRLRNTKPPLAHPFYKKTLKITVSSADDLVIACLFNLVNPLFSPFIHQLNDW